MPRSSRDQSVLRQVFSILPPHRRRQAIATGCLMVVGAIADLVSIGAVFPFLALLTDPTHPPRLPVLGTVEIPTFGGLDPTSVVTLAFITLLLVSGSIRLLLSWKTQALAFNASYDMSVIAFRKLVHQPYTFYLNRSSSEALSSFEKIQTITYSVLLSGVQALVSTTLAVLIITFLFIVEPLIAIVAAGVLIGAYGIAILSMRTTLARNSGIIANCWADRVKKVQEALGGIRDVLLDRSQPILQADFDRSAKRVSKALAANAFIGGAPRIVVEVLGMMLVGGVAWYIARGPVGLEGSIPTLGAMAIGAQRLLPLLQMSYNGWTSLIGSSRSIEDVLDLMNLPEETPAQATGGLPFDREIRFERVDFGYSSDLSILSGIDFQIKKGERIGIVGKTGSGKSTLTDLLLGLLEPTAGQITVDGAVLDAKRRSAWQDQLAHVPQNIYLADDTLAANIAFGVAPDRVDMQRVEEAARSAGIHDFISGLPDGYSGSCGERGVRLSGGQRQRIGIARALYKRPDVLILDEATSALDNATEKEVMASIANLSDQVTLVMVAHRLTTLTGCDRVLCLEGGKIAKIVDSVTAGV